jgi:hypothetical protein
LQYEVKLLRWLLDPLEAQVSPSILTDLIIDSTVHRGR